MTFSVCMIVKNEEKTLARCLDSLKGIEDEIIIVDTGSSDKTKEIASRYTDKVYDFAWADDFSAARNFAFSFATCDYIYSADADEVIDSENRQRFLNLKKCLLPEIEIVQMIYVNPADINMAYNDLKELRPKLFKRLRTFTWIDPIHETVRLDPVVYDSDIEILHKPTEMHASRDFEALKKALVKHGTLSDRLFSMYAKELFFNGTPGDFKSAEPYFRKRIDSSETFECLEALCVVARSALEKGDYEDFIEFSKEYASFVNKPAELDSILGRMFLEKGDSEKAAFYFDESKKHENYIMRGYNA